MRKTLTLLALTLAGTLVLTGCPKAQTVRGVSAAVAEGARQFKSEVARLVEAGDLTEAEGDLLTPAADEVANAAGGFVARAADWNTMTKAERIDLAGDAVEEIGASVERLSEKNILIKSSKAKARLDKRLREARFAVAGLRVVRASLPPPEAAPE